MSCRYEKLRQRAASIEVASTMRDGTEIVFCGDVGGEYVGWTPRETAETHGYPVRYTPEDSELLALLEETERYRLALEQIAETSRWYADNGQRLAHEVDHALCVEIVSLAERALDTG